MTSSPSAKCHACAQAFPFDRETSLAIGADRFVCSEECRDLAAEDLARCPFCACVFHRPVRGSRPREFCDKACTDAASWQRLADRRRLEKDLPTFAEVEAERDALAVEVEALRAERDAAEAKADRIAAQAFEAFETVDTLQEETSTMRDENAALRAQVVEAEARAIAAEERARAAEERAAERGAVALAAASRAEGLTVEVSRLEAEVERLTLSRARVRSLYEAVLDEYVPVPDLDDPAGPSGLVTDRDLSLLLADALPSEQNVLRGADD